VKFIETYLRVPKGKGARKSVRLRPWQKQIIRGVLKPSVRQGLVSMPRGNGKSALAAMLAVFGLFEGIEGAQVLTVASDERQARISWNMARRMIELNDELASRCQIFQDRIVVPHTDSVLAPLPAEPDALQGWDPSLCVVDELHVVTEDVYDAMQLASGKRDRSLILAISTAAGDRDGVMYRLTEHGRTADDPAFYFVEYAAPEGCDVADEAAWKLANPALGDFLSIDALRSTLRTTREEVFRRYRLNQWVGTVGAWLPWGLWDARAVSRVVKPKERAVFAFDGSASGDSTALVGATVEAEPFVFLAGLWENPGDERWRVPRADVDRAIAEAFEQYDVAELVCDPWGWRSEIESWSERFKHVSEYPTNAVARMAPASDRFYAAVADGKLSHDGDERLSRHVGHCVAESTAHGDVVRKDRRGSPRKIDAAIAAILAYDRAKFHASNPPERKSKALYTFS
jgi:phage terminase large subunit-like protein